MCSNQQLTAATPQSINWRIKTNLIDTQITRSLDQGLQCLDTIATTLQEQGLELVSLVHTIIDHRRIHFHCNGRYQERTFDLRGRLLYNAHTLKWVAYHGAYDTTNLITWIKQFKHP